MYGALVAAKCTLSKNDALGKGFPNFSAHRPHCFANNDAQDRLDDTCIS